MIPVLLLYVIDESTAAEYEGPGTPPSFETSVAK